MTDDRLVAALALAARGWRVHPIHPIRDGVCGCGSADCEAAGKHPRLKAWQRAASADPEQVRRWWSARPEDGIGVATGPSSGLVVVDLDPRHGGDASFAAALRERGERLETLRVRTGGGGWHLYFVAPPRRIGNRAGVLPGVDVRGAGGYVVGPGSPHVSGQNYVLDRDVEPVPMPDWLVELCAGRPAERPPTPPTSITGDDRERRYALAALDHAQRRIAETGEGGRHDAVVREAYAIGGYVGAGLLSEAVARAGLIEAALACGLGEREAVRAVEDAIAAGAAAPVRAPAPRPEPGSRPRLVAVGGAAPVPVPDPQEEPDAAPLMYPAVRDWSGRGRGCSPPPWPDVFLTRAKTTRIPHGSAANVRAALVEDRRWRGVLWHDELAARPRWGDDLVQDEHLVALATWLDAAYGLRVAPGMVRDQIASIATADRRDVVRDWLLSLRWDGRPRADTWLTDVFGAADTPLHRSYARAWLVGCVARAMQPGCKLDTVLVLVGGQGARKSTALRALVGPDWYSDTAIDLAGKDGLMQLDGAWVVELAELSGMRRQRMDVVKALLSSQVDVYRRPYAREVTRTPRRAVLVGTENRDDFLADETGSRRFWPVRTARADPALAAERRDQLWAEAVQLWREDEPWHLGGEAEEDRAEAAQGFAAEDPWAEAVLRHVDCLQTTTIPALLDRVVHVEPDRQDVASVKRVAAILRGAGWQQHYDHEDGRTRRVWCKT